jgi:hypothetical protein
MFGFSLPKLLVLILIIAVIWYGFKWVTEVDRDRRRKVKEEKQAAKAERSGPAQVDAHDMVKCPRCGTFVAPASARNCGREDCPYPS